MRHGLGKWARSEPLGAGAALAGAGAARGRGAGLGAGAKEERGEGGAVGEESEGGAVAEEGALNAVGCTQRSNNARRSRLKRPGPRCCARFEVRTLMLLYLALARRRLEAEL